jgi:hypothetical protein
VPIVETKPVDAPQKNTGNRFLSPRGDELKKMLVESQSRLSCQARTKKRRCNRLGWHQTLER